MTKFIVQIVSQKFIEYESVSTLGFDVVKKKIELKFPLTKINLFEVCKEVDKYK